MTEIITENEVEVVNPNLVETDIAVIETQNTITPTNAFTNILAEIPERLTKVNDLLAEYRTNPDEFVEKYDEDSFDDVVRELAEINRFATKVSAGRTEIRKWFNAQRDKVVSQLDEKLNEVGFDSLTKAQADAKQLKADTIAVRLNKRWKELEATFKGNVTQYAILERLAPELTDFSRFKLVNAKLVSGAKNKPVTDKIRAHVNDIMYGWSTALTAIESNGWGLNPEMQNKLLQGFRQNPTVDYVHSTGPSLKQQQDAAEEAARQMAILREAELKRAEENRIKRQEQMKALQEQQAQAKLINDEKARQEALIRQGELRKQMEAAQLAEKQRLDEIETLSSQYVRPQVRESFPHFVNYLFGSKEYKDVHSSSKVKARVVYDVATQMGDKNSVVYSETQGDPEKFLDLIRFVLDV